MSILDERRAYKPFEYEWAYDYWQTQHEQHWLHFEVLNMPASVDDWNYHLTETEKSVIKNVLLGFTQTEIYIGAYWGERVPRWFPKHEIALMGRAFADYETIHQVAYNYLNDTLGLEEYDVFLKDPAAAAKLNNFIECPNDTLYERALSLAVYSGFAEGVSLYSSFAILLSFSKRNLLKGVGEIVSYSVRDECYSGDTEVLTPNGWVRFDALKGNEELAQFDMQTQEISFTKPSRFLIKAYDGKMVKFGGEKLALRANVTENHDMVCKYDYATGYSKRKAKDIRPNPKMLVPLAGYKTEGTSKNLTPFERFLIALQADGSLSNRYTGSVCGTLPVTFSLSKQRKIDRLTSIINELGFTYTLGNRASRGKAKPKTVFRVNVPVEYKLSKTFDWVNLKEITSKWAVDFVEELQHWDGHLPYNGDYIYYSSVVPENLDVVQSICAIGGMSTTWSVQVDSRKESYRDVQRLYIHKKDFKRLGCLTKEVYDYEGLVYCATVEKGTLVTRYDKSVSISGNCLHSEAGCLLYRTLVEENPWLITNTDLEDRIIDACRTTVQLEHEFIDMVFNHENLVDLEANAVKAFIEHRADLKLMDLNLKPIFNPDPEVVRKISEWFYLMTASENHDDFFASRVTTYSKGVFNPSEINWDVVFSN